MGKKLGQILVEKRFLTQSQLKKALDAQLIFGGKLGTNLIELGYVDEPTLVAALQSQKSSEAAAPEEFDRVSPAVVRMIPAKVAERHKVIPLALHEKKLRVAMLDPGDLLILDELQFLTGCSIEPLVASETRVLQALEDLYHVPRRIRYVTLPEEIRRQIEEGQEAERSAAASASPRPPIEVTAAPPPAAAAEEAPPAGVSAVPAASPRAEEAVEAREVLRRAEEAERGPIRTVEEVGRRLAMVETRDEIGEVLLRFLEPVFGRSALFILQKAQTLGWAGAGADVTTDTIRRILIPADLPSVFDTLRRGASYYLGELEDLPGNALLTAGLGGARPGGVFLIPIELQGRIIAAVYGDNGPGAPPRADLRALRAVVQKASLALEMLLIKHRILL